MKASRRKFIVRIGSGLILTGNASWANALLKTPKPPLPYSPPDGPDVSAQTFGRSIGKPVPAPARPPVPPVPPVSPPPPSTSLLDADLWDGASGITSLYFNVGALLPWEHKGGDWTDATGVAQGTGEYARLVSSTTGAFSADITALVKKWYASGDTGAYLLASGAATLALRSNTDVSKRPTLLLTDATGKVTTVSCTSSGAIDVNTAYAVQASAYTFGDGKHLALQFDLPFPQPAFASARLQLTSTYNYSVPLTLKVFALRPPRLFAGAAPTLGLAGNYVGDAGIEKDPDVYVTGFDPSVFPEGSLTLDSAATVDSTFPAAINAVYKVGDFSACTLDHRWSTKRDTLSTRNPNNSLLIREEIPSANYLAQANSDCPGEVYFRYYLKLKTGYQCSVEGKKLPGLAGRYGIWTGDDHFGYYSSQTGNGGAPTTGDFDGKSLNGWSMRHHAYVGPADANPLHALVPINYYAYHVKMQGYFGDFWRWGNPKTGYVNLVPDRWYCIEHYVKINSLLGPYDALGNGVPVADGIVRGWLDGVLVFEKTDVVLRKHPAIRIDEVWLDHYHGGTTPADALHPFAMAALVVARKYIGPQKTLSTPSPNPTSSPGPTGVVPAWLAGTPVNQWMTIPGTALSASTDLSTQVAAGLCAANGSPTSYGRPLQGIMDFSGGTLKRDGSEMLIFGGGGAGAWGGNDVRSLRLEDPSPVWRTVVNPSPAASLWPRVTGQVAHPYMQNGAPNSRHSYWQPQFIDSLNKFMAFGCQNVWEIDNGTYNVVDAAPIGGKWDAAGAHPNIPAARNYDGSWVCKDPRTDVVYASSAQAIHRYSPGTNTWTTIYNSSGANGIERGCAAIDTKRNLILRIGYWGNNTAQPVTVNLTTLTATAASFSGPYAASVTNVWTAGLVYDPILDKFLLFRDDGYLYAITYVSDTQWSIDRLNVVGTAPSVAGSGVHNGGTCAIWGRMQYVPNLKGVCILQRYDQPAFFVRTA